MRIQKVHIEQDKQLCVFVENIEAKIISKEVMKELNCSKTLNVAFSKTLKMLQILLPV